MARVTTGITTSHIPALGAAIERRLVGFEVASVTRVARRARTEPVEVHGTEDLLELLALADVAFLMAPHTPQTEGMISRRELAALPDGALLVADDVGDVIWRVTARYAVLRASMAKPSAAIDFALGICSVA